MYVLVSFPRSLSYILLLGGFGYFVLAVFYLIIDVFPFWSGAPFKYPGTYVSACVHVCACMHACMRACSVCMPGFHLGGSTGEAPPLQATEFPLLICEVDHVEKFQNLPSFGIASFLV